MKEMDPLETQLRSWQPRRPSAKLKRQLFGATSQTVSKAVWLLGSLAPATACLLLTLSFFNSNNGISRVSARPEPLLAMILSNQNYTAYETGHSQNRENNWSAITFDWTNRSGSTSSIAPFSRDKMN
jgi:hypothetical protein